MAFTYCTAISKSHPKNTKKFQTKKVNNFIKLPFDSNLLEKPQCENHADTRMKCDVVTPPVNADSAEVDGQPWFTGPQLFYCAGLPIGYDLSPAEGILGLYI